MEAPCIIVLSTSKNAAAVGSTGTCRLASTSAAAADAIPAATALVVERDRAAMPPSLRGMDHGQWPTPSRIDDSTGGGLGVWCSTELRPPVGRCVGSFVGSLVGSFVGSLVGT